MGHNAVGVRGDMERVCMAAGKGTEGWAGWGWYVEIKRCSPGKMGRLMKGPTCSSARKSQWSDPPMPAVPLDTGYSPAAGKPVLSGWASPSVVLWMTRPR